MSKADWPPPLHIDPKTTVVVTIDLKRKYLDAKVATRPVSREEACTLIASTQRLLVAARGNNIPIVYVTLTSHASSRVGPALPFHPYSRQGAGVPPAVHPPGRDSPEDQIQPELAPKTGDVVIDYKRSFSSFDDTDLDRVLKRLGAETVVLAGLNTNTCILCAVLEADNRGYRVVVAEDCVASAYGRDLHEEGLKNIRRCLGWVIPAAEVERLFDCSKNST